MTGTPHKRPRLVTLHTHPMTTRVLLRGQLAFLRESGFEVLAVASPGWELDEAGRQEGVATYGVPMERELSPLRDLVSLVRLYFLLRKLRPEIVFAGTPKASLLGMLAAWALRVPVRIYNVKGLRLETLRGWKRRLLAAAERLTSACATRVICEGPSLREAYIAAGLAPREKTAVVGPGLPNGLDAERFAPEAHAPEQLAALREQLRIPADAFVVGFVGRLVRDKGICELYDALELLREDCPRMVLLLVGDFEPGDPVPRASIERIERHPRIFRTGYQADTAPFYALMDVLAFPSYREGFPNVPMEAAAAEVPTVGFIATGTVDAVQDGVTGQLVPCGDTAGLAQALRSYYDSEELRATHGAAARRRAATEFRREPIWQALLAEYRRLLAQRGLPLPAPSSAPQQTEPLIGASER